MTDVERRLRGLARDLEHPPTPDVAGAVARRLGAGRPRNALRARRIATAVAAAVLLPGGAIAAVPSVREVLGIAGVRVQTTTKSLAPPRTRALDLGTRVTPARAASLVRFTVLAPRAAGLGAPDALYYRRSPPGGALTLVYEPRAGLPRSGLTQTGPMLTMFLGTSSTRFIGKLAGPGTSVERVTVAGEEGAWLAGRPHQFAYTDARGDHRVDTLRLAGNTLLWQRGRLTLRLEGALSKAAALRIARSVR